MDSAPVNDDIPPCEPVYIYPTRQTIEPVLLYLPKIILLDHLIMKLLLFETTTPTIRSKGVSKQHDNGIRGLINEGSKGSRNVHAPR